MARAILNGGLSSVRGKVDNWVYRLYRGKIVISRRSVSTSEPSVAQLERRAQFRDACAYAKAVLVSPDLREFYQPRATELGTTVFQAAITDRLSPPVVEEIDHSAYHGAIDDRIVIRAFDRIGVVGVSVVVRAKDGWLLEQGASAREGRAWVYRALTNRTPGQPIAITATAVDRAGRVGIKTVTWT